MLVIGMDWDALINGTESFEPVDSVLGVSVDLNFDTGVAFPTDITIEELVDLYFESEAG